MGVNIFFLKGGGVYVLAVRIFGEMEVSAADWLEHLISRPLLARCADHPLVLLQRQYDPSAVVAACAGFHRAPAGTGAEGVTPN